MRPYWWLIDLMMACSFRFQIILSSNSRTNVQNNMLEPICRLVWANLVWTSLHEHGKCCWLDPIRNINNFSATIFWLQSFSFLQVQDVALGSGTFKARRWEVGSSRTWQSDTVDTVWSKPQNLQIYEVNPWSSNMEVVSLLETVMLLFKRQQHHISMCFYEAIPCDSTCDGFWAWNLNARWEIRRIGLGPSWQVVVCSLSGKKASHVDMQHLAQEKHELSRSSWRRRSKWLSMHARAQKQMRKQIHGWQTFSMMPAFILWHPPNDTEHVLFLKVCFEVSGQCTSTVAGGISSPFECWRLE